MMNEKHIVLFSIWSILNNKGGIAKVFCSMANELLSRGYKVSAICLFVRLGLQYIVCRRSEIFYALI